ncbi:unnamed protein product [Albugo candida]|nr:unnamed protein product [Albugo candida]|eukprot:CCI49430.1 unnamed protein product [Albugo candida]
MEPADTISFVLPATRLARDLNDRPLIRSAISLTNISFSKILIVKVQTTSVKSFTVSPPVTIIKPGESQWMIITALAYEVDRLLSMTSNAKWNQIPERFLFQTVELTDIQTTHIENPAECWRQCPKERIISCQLLCHYVVGNATQQQAELESQLSEILDRDNSKASFQLSNHDLEENNESNHVAEAFDIQTLENEQAQEQADARDSEFSSARDGLEQLVMEDPPSYRIFPSEWLVFGVTSNFISEAERVGLIDYIIPLEARLDGENILSSAHLRISNEASHHYIAFKIKTTNHLGYYVKPSKGFIAPKENKTIQLQLVQRDDSVFDPGRRESSDRFQVSIIFLKESEINIEAVMEPTNRKEEKRYRREMMRVWNNVTASDTEKSVLRCQILQMFTKEKISKHSRLQKSLSSKIIDPHKSSCFNQVASSSSQVYNPYAEDFGQIPEWSTLLASIDK